MKKIVYKITIKPFTIPAYTMSEQHIAPSMQPNFHFPFPPS